MIRRLAPLFSVLLALGCGSPTGVVDEFDLGEPFSIRLGESKLSADGGTLVRFVRVVTDSRCGPGVVCVWAGEAIVALEVYSPMSAELSRTDTRPQLSIAVPTYEVKVGAPEPYQAGGRWIEALGLTFSGAGLASSNGPTARLRIGLSPTVHAMTH